MSIIIRDLNLKNNDSDSFIYRDLDFYQLQGKRNVLELDDFDAIRNSINNIFLIKRGTRILDPEFGSDLDAFLFEQINDTNARLLGESVEELLNQEPRILVDTIDVQVDKVNSLYRVEIDFIVPSLSRERLNTSFDLIQGEGIALNNN